MHDFETYTVTTLCMLFFIRHSHEHSLQTSPTIDPPCHKLCASTLCFGTTLGGTYGPSDRSCRNHPWGTKHMYCRLTIFHACIRSQCLSRNSKNWRLCLQSEMEKPTLQWLSLSEDAQTPGDWGFSNTEPPDMFRKTELFQLVSLSYQIVLRHLRYLGVVSVAATTACPAWAFPMEQYRVALGQYHGHAWTSRRKKAIQSHTIVCLSRTTRNQLSDTRHVCSRLAFFLKLARHTAAMGAKRGSKEGIEKAPKKQRVTSSKKNSLAQLADDEAKKETYNRELTAMTARLKYQASTACKKA